MSGTDVLLIIIAAIFHALLVGGYGDTVEQCTKPTYAAAGVDQEAALQKSFDEKRTYPFDLDGIPGTTRHIFQAATGSTASGSPQLFECCA